MAKMVNAKVCILKNRGYQYKKLGKCGIYRVCHMFTPWHFCDKSAMSKFVQIHFFVT